MGAGICTAPLPLGAGWQHKHDQILVLPEPPNCHPMLLPLFGTQPRGCGVGHERARCVRVWGACPPGQPHRRIGVRAPRGSRLPGGDGEASGCGAEGPGDPQTKAQDDSGPKISNEAGKERAGPRGAGKSPPSPVERTWEGTSTRHPPVGQTGAWGFLPRLLKPCVAG